MYSIYTMKDTIKQVQDLRQLALERVSILNKILRELENQETYEDKVLEQAYKEDRWQDKKWNAEDMAQEQYTEGQE